MSAEYFDGFGFGLAEEPVGEAEPHAHSWLTHPWRVRDFPGMDIYDCACGARRFVPKGVHPAEGEDAPVRSFPESCPQWSVNYATEPSLLLTCPPEVTAPEPAPMSEADWIRWIGAFLENHTDEEPDEDEI